MSSEESSASANATKLAPSTSTSGIDVSRYNNEIGPSSIRVTRHIQQTKNLIFLLPRIEAIHLGRLQTKK